MNDPTHSLLSERITQQYVNLTQSNRRLADYLQSHPEKVLMLSTSEIADACQVSKTSVSRFIRKLGYDDHQALRNELLAEREKGQPMVVTSLSGTVFNHEVQALEKLWAQLSAENHGGLISKIATAKRVKIIGYRNSYPLAMHFRQQLMQCRSNVDLLPLPGQTIGEDLTGIEQDDFVIMIGIRRRVTNFAQMMDFLSQYDCLLITDQSGQHYIPQVTHGFICYLNHEQPLDSYAVPMSLIAHLVNQTFIYLSEQATQMSHTIRQNYVALHELE